MLLFSDFNDSVRETHTGDHASLKEQQAHAATWYDRPKVTKGMANVSFFPEHCFIDEFLPSISSLNCTDHHCLPHKNQSQLQEITFG